MEAERMERITPSNLLAGFGIVDENTGKVLFDSVDDLTRWMKADWDYFIEVLIQSGLLPKMHALEFLIGTVERSDLYMTIDLKAREIDYA
jgi:hypothetical protein